MRKSPSSMRSRALLWSEVEKSALFPTRARLLRPTDCMNQHQAAHDPTSEDTNHPDGITALLDKSEEDAPPERRPSQNKKEPGAKDGEKKESQKEDDAKDSKEKDGDKEKKPDKPPVYKRPAVIIPVSAFLLIAIIGGIVYWLHARHYVSTDDAYIDGHVTQISPQIAALVVKLHITDNQFVQQGDLVIELY